jgi:PAS fold
MLIAPGHVDEVRLILDRIRRGERIERYETERQHKDGHIIAISLTVSPIRDDAGRVIGASKIARDITEAKRARGAARTRSAAALDPRHDPGRRCDRGEPCREAETHSNRWRVVALLLGGELASQVSALTWR